MAKNGKFSKKNMPESEYQPDYQEYEEYQDYTQDYSQDFTRDYSQDFAQDYSQNAYGEVNEDAYTNTGDEYYQAPQKKKRKHSPLWLKIFVFFLMLLLGGVIALCVMALKQTNSHPEVKTSAAYRATVKEYSMDELLTMAKENVEYVASSKEETVPYANGDFGKTGKVLNVLVVGQDSREGPEASKNSDTMILCSLNKETKVLHLSSFLRDSYVKLATYKGHTATYRINAAYALGYLYGGDAGAFEMLDNTIINNFGATIDYNVEISLECFENIINAVGGIDVELDADEAKYMNKFVSMQGYDVNYSVGTAHLYGVGALVYARMRHETYGGSDMKRTNRQRVVFAQVIEKLKKMSVSELNALVKEVLGYVITDMTDEEITTCVIECLPVLPSLTVESRQFPLEGTYRGEMKDIDNNGIEAGVLVPYDLQKNQRVLKAICAGEPIPES